MSKKNTEKYELERILDTGTLEKEWNPAFEQMFTDENDREPIEQLRERIADPDRNAFHVLRDSKGKVVGLNLLNFDPDIPGSMYCPYGGVSEEMRGVGMYPLMTQVSDKLMRDHGASYCLNDCEDPARVPDYLGGGETAKVAERRINFFRRSMNVIYVDDPAVPYVRPSSENEQDIQAYDLMGIRALNNDFGPVYKNLKEKGLTMPLFNHPDPNQATGMSKEAYRLFYLEMSRLQFGDLSESALRERFPAINKFLSDIDACPKPYMDIVVGDVRKKDLAAKGDIKADIDVKASDKASILPQNHLARHVSAP